MEKLITPAEAEALILSSVQQLTSELTSLEFARKRVLRAPLYADRDFPPFDRVTMDGIAFRCNEWSPDKSLKLHGIHAAGETMPEALPKAHCWQIMTGAILPDDCDTIVPYESLTFTETEVTIDRSFTPEPGAFIHREGSDCSVGALLLEKNTQLNAAHLGLAASLGATKLEVSRLPRIHIFTTGDELIPISQTPAKHQLRRSNGLSLKTALEAWGPSQIQLTHLPDDFNIVHAALKHALSENDLLIVSGGISRGKKDYVRPVLESLVGPPTFHGVAQRPGKPLAFWQATSLSPAIFALPGNPNSTLMSFYRYVAPALHQLIGSSSTPPITLPFAQPIPQHPKLSQLLPARINPQSELELLLPQNSGDFLTPLAATGFVEILPNSTEKCGLYQPFD